MQYLRDHKTSKAIDGRKRDSEQLEEHGKHTAIAQKDNGGKTGDECRGYQWNR